MDLAKQETTKRSNPLRIKKLYVLAARLVEEHQEHLLKTNKEGVRSSALIGLLEDGNLLTTQDAGTLDNAWRGVEAYHFLMLCQKQLYEGFVDAAMKTALHLRDYEDILSQQDIYSLLALSSCANRAFGTTSRAFIKLESLEELSPQQRDEYEELAMDIFVKHAPNDSRLGEFLSKLSNTVSYLHRNWTASHGPDFNLD